MKPKETVDFIDELTSPVKAKPGAQPGTSAQADKPSKDNRGSWRFKLLKDANGDTVEIIAEPIK